jgi:hypothetical protein
MTQNRTGVGWRRSAPALSIPLVLARALGHLKDRVLRRRKTARDQNAHSGQEAPAVQEKTNGAEESIK